MRKLLALALASVMMLGVIGGAFAEATPEPVLGEIAGVLTKVFGLITLALGVQFVLTGIGNSFPKRKRS